MQPLKILYIITKLELGGAQKQLLALIGSLNKDKFQPFLLTGVGGLLDEDAGAIKGLVIKRSARLKRQISLLDDWLALWEIRSFIKKNNIDIVHTHSSKAGIVGRFAAKLAGAGIIVHTVHGWSFNDYQLPFVRWTYICLERIAASFSSALIVVSEHDRQKGLKLHIGSPGKYSLIRYGIDRSGFPSVSRPLRSLSDPACDELTVCTVSCFKPQKSPADFIQLAAGITKKYNNVKFVVVGDGVLRGELEGLIEQFSLQGKVLLCGWQRDISRLLASADIFVLTSLWEGLPIAVLEALSCGLPVVATDTGGISEVIEEGRNGFLCRCRDVRQMTGKLQALLEDKALRTKMATVAAKSLGTEFNSATMFDNTQKLYTELAGKGNCSHV